jgi:hypothetical protein
MKADPARWRLNRSFEQTKSSQLKSSQAKPSQAKSSQVQLSSAESII